MFYLRCLLCLGFLELLGLLIGGPVLAQNDGLPAGEPGLKLRSVGRAMHGRLHTDGWLNLTVTVSNTADRDLPVRIVALLPAVPELQSARVAIIPARSTQQLALSVYAPPSILPSDLTEIEVSLYRVAEENLGTPSADLGWNEELVTVAGIPQRSGVTLRAEATKTKMLTALSPEPPGRFAWQWPFREPYYDYEMVVSSRVRALGSRATVGLEGSYLPLSRADWHDTQLLLVSEASVFEDAAAILAMQQFVHEGGRIWFMLENIPAQRIEPLLGNGQSLAELDRVELNQFDLELHYPFPDKSDRIARVDRDQPFSFKRVVQTGGRVTHSIEGWPAVIWMKVGYGDIVLTTLSSAAWLTAGSESPEPMLSTAFRVSRAGVLLGADIYEPGIEPPLQESVDYPLELVGSPVLPRARVALVLLSFLALLTASGVISLSVGKLSRLGWLAPVLALAVGLLLVISSAWTRRDIPETQAMLQLIRISELGNTASIREQGVVYLETQREMSLQGEHDGYALADQSVQSGIKRLQTGGLTGWQLQNMAWPTGSWRYMAHQAKDSDEMVAIGAFDSEGLKLRLPDALQQLQDVVVSFVPGQPMVGRVQSGVVSADGALMASADRWVADSIISDEQRRRIAVYQQFFASKNQQLPPIRSLLGWTEAWPEVQCTEELKRAGGALISLPIRLQRPVAGAPLLIPAGMVRLSKDSSDAGQSPAFDQSSGLWAEEMTIETRSGLQFLLPHEVLPFRAESIDLYLGVRAPSRLVRLLALVPGEADVMEEVEIARLESPSLPWQGRLDDARVLASVEDGKLDIVLEISKRKDVESDGNASSFVAWRVDTLRASLRGSRVATELSE